MDNTIAKSVIKPLPRPDDNFILQQVPMDQKPIARQPRVCGSLQMGYKTPGKYGSTSRGGRMFAPTKLKYEWSVEKLDPLQLAVYQELCRKRGVPAD